MANYLTRNLRQTITYWAPSTPDGYGGYSYGSPQWLIGRWEDRIEDFIDQNGRELTSRAVVYLDRDVEMGGYLFLGKSSATNPQTLSDAREIRDFRKIPSLRNRINERKVRL